MENIAKKKVDKRKKRSIKKTPQTETKINKILELGNFKSRSDLAKFISGGKKGVINRGQLYPAVKTIPRDLDNILNNLLDTLQAKEDITLLPKRRTKKQRTAAYKRADKAIIKAQKRSAKSKKASRTRPQRVFMVTYTCRSSERVIIHEFMSKATKRVKNIASYIDKKHKMVFPAHVIQSQTKPKRLT